MIKIRDAIKGTTKINYTKRPALYAQQCAGCGRLFQMRGRKLENPTHTPGSMWGIFDRGAEDRDGRGLGNMFSVSICSFTCAEKVQAGGWKAIKEYKPYAKNGAVLERVEVYITSPVLSESDLIAEWEQRIDQPAPKEAGEGILYIGGGYS